MRRSVSRLSPVPFVVLLFLLVVAGVPAGPALADSGWIAQSSGVTSRLNAIAFSSDGQMGWIAGDGGVVLKSTDAGATWTSLPSGTTVDLKGVAIDSSGNVYVVGTAGTIRRTTDGSSWEDLT